MGKAGPAYNLVRCLECHVNNGRSLRRRWVSAGRDVGADRRAGRARTLLEASLWHGGEADRSRAAFEALPARDREALLAYLKSL